ncbi:MAG: ArsR family transcriptional regulator [Proteobacteria bacterium]|nr:ArsR family transcriptional regulator [Pseudomonadota bacterium]
MSYADEVAADRRLMILRALEATTGYGANVTLIGLFLDSKGHKASHDLLQGDLAWLTEQGFVELKDEAVLLTQRGADIAAGRARHPGVRRPRPGE